MTAAAERDTLRVELRRFTARAAGHEQIRHRIAATDPHDSGMWKVLAGQFGLSGLGVPEDLGGVGGGWAELLVAFEELGAVLLPSPLLATRALAITVLLESGDGEACADLVPALAAGESRGTLVTGPGSVLARRAGTGYVLEGCADLVLDGATADVIVAPAAADGGRGLWVVTPGAAGVRREPRAVVDPTRPAARLRFDGAPARRLAVRRTADEVLRQTTDLARIALAAEQLGGARRCLDMTVDHVKQRQAFGRPVGSFQAVKHACADVLLEVDALRPAVEEAARLADEEPASLAGLVPAVAAHAAETYHRAAAACVHLHGGMGFTWEHPAQLYYKRAMTSARLFGSPQDHRERSARTLLG
jgi:alkylation response protein AidB-like acyl-CoA dehydrogenase